MGNIKNQRLCWCFDNFSLSSHWKFQPLGFVYMTSTLNTYAVFHCLKALFRSGDVLIKVPS